MITIRVNLEAMEALMYFWEATRGREKVNEKFINALAALSPMPSIYDETFSAETVRKVLSAITNREPLAPSSRPEGRFFNNNLWMLEDLALPREIMSCIKVLNLDTLAVRLSTDLDVDREITVYFAPLHLEPVYCLKGSVVLNFFLLQPDYAGGLAFSGEDLFSSVENIVRSSLLSASNQATHD